MGLSKPQLILFLFYRGEIKKCQDMDPYLLIKLLTLQQQLLIIVTLALKLHNTSLHYLDGSHAIIRCLFKLIIFPGDNPSIH